MRILIVGAGFSGAVLARELARRIGSIDVTIIDKRGHIAGNCFTERDSVTGIMEHVYGPHIFHTNNYIVWDYVNQFSRFMPFINRVKAVTDKGVYSLPINLLTINQFFNKKFTPEEAKNFLKEISDNSIENPLNFQEQALKFIGIDLYYNFFYGYTKKQWGCEPTYLPASILKRLPIRFNYDDNYYNSKYQGVPIDGYTKVIENILDFPGIEVKLNMPFTKEMAAEYNHIFYSGPIDEYFNYKFGRLGYRTVFFEKNYYEGDFQGNAVINYCSSKVPFTRIHEHKHFTPWEEHKSSIYFKEFSKETDSNDIPYYPKRLSSDKEKLMQYHTYALEVNENITFIGRLGTYRYLDMHQVIEESLNFAEVVVESLKNNEKIPVFLNKEL